MSGKDLSRVTTDLSALAGSLPTQNMTSSRTPEAQTLVTTEKSTTGNTAQSRTPEAQTPTIAQSPDDEIIQVNVSMRKRLRRELNALSNDADMTVRAFVLNALKEKGLSVEAEDLVDLRKKKG